MEPVFRLCAWVVLYEMASDSTGHRTLLVNGKPAEVLKRLGLEFHLTCHGCNCSHNERFSPVRKFSPEVGLAMLSPIQRMPGAANLSGILFTWGKPGAGEAVSR